MATITIDARLYGLEHSGVGRYIINLLENLKRLDDKNKYNLILRKKYFDQLNFPENFNMVLCDIPHYTVREQLKLPKILKNNKSDLVHFPHLNVPIFYKGPFVVTLHDMTMHHQKLNATTLPVPLYFSKRVPYKIAFRYATEKSKKIIVPSKAVKDELSSYFNVDPGKIVVTYEGVRDDFSSKVGIEGELQVLSKYQLKPSSYFFYLGNAYPHKNVEVVIDAITLINKKSRENYYFAIGGSRDVFVQRLQRYIRKKKAQNFVKVIGYIPDEDLPIIYKNSISFVYPSLSEGFGLQGLEAMQSETLLIASEIPVFKEVYGENALYFDPNDPVSLAEKMDEVINLSYQKRNEMISSGKNTKNEYSWNKMTKETISVYEDCIDL